MSKTISLKWSKRLVFVALAFVPVAGFSEQLFDTLTYKGKENTIEEAPLDSFILQETLTELIQPLSDCMAENRCYTAHWEISDDTLYLRSIRKKGGVNFSLKNLFPSSTGPVKAEWFSGNIRVHSGETMFLCSSPLILIVEVGDGFFMQEKYECPKAN